MARILRMGVTCAAVARSIMPSGIYVGAPSTGEITSVAPFMIRSS